MIRYGNERGVDLILWVLWKPLDKNLTQIPETYKKRGAKGIKVDFHGVFKPSGLRRTYPNVINYEGVKGSENNKWSKDITPDHNVTIPFIRMAAGPMDYTPGVMNKKQEHNYTISFERPMSQGTRAHQAAMYVVYEAPLQMLCESPSRYYQEQETVDFIVQIPTTWDETIVLHGSIGDYIALARRKGDKWYIGAMTDWTIWELELNLSFLKEGSFRMEVFKDGFNAHRFAEDYELKTLEVNKNSKISVQMAAGGGWTAIISKQNIN